MSEDDAKIGECDCCGYEPVMTSPYDDRIAAYANKVPELLWLCDFCAGTHASTAKRYPEQFPNGVGDILAAICYVGNALAVRSAS